MQQTEKKEVMNQKTAANNYNMSFSNQPPKIFFSGATKEIKQKQKIIKQSQKYLK